MMDFNVTLKPDAAKAINGLVYGSYALFGVVFIWLSVKLLLSDHVAERFLSILMLCIAAFLIIIGVGGLLDAIKKVHLVPQGIAVTLWGRTVARYPIEQIGMFFAVQWWNKGWVRILGISTHTPEEMSNLREAQLSRSVFSRDELKFRKRVPDWQKTFRQEYLLKRGRSAWLMFWKRDILWLNLQPQTVAMLRYYYPNTPWEYRQDKGDGIGNVSDWADEDPVAFSRAKNVSFKNEKDAVIGFAIFFVPLIFLSIFVEGAQMMFVLSVLVGLIVGIIVCLTQSESDMFQLSPAGIRIMRRKQEYAVMFADDICTMIKCEGNGLGGGFGGSSIIVSTARMEELISRGITAEKKQGSISTKEIPGWELCVLFRYCTQERMKMRSKNGDCQRMDWNAQREQTLRELYPQARWIDVTPNAIYEITS